MAYDKRRSEYLHLDLLKKEQPILYISEAHGNRLEVQSEIANIFKEYPNLHIERVQLDFLKEKQKSQGRPGMDNEFSNQQQKVIKYFSQAKEKGASDIHLLIGLNDVTVVQFRVHGDLETIDKLDFSEGMSLASTIVLSMCDVVEPSFNPNREQGSRIRKEFLQGLKLFGARYAHIPAEFGLYVVMRILPDEGTAPPTLDDLGFLAEQQVLIRRMLARPEGVIILSGPTGSGKSTTLRTFSEMYLAFTGHRKRLLTLEDPPEGLIRGAVQTPIIADKNDPEAVSLAWVRSISAALRLDPDAMIIGEIRDTNSVKSGLTAAKSGHLVITTLHANDAVGIADRLTDTLGIPMGQVADPQVMIGLIAQRLVQLLCPKCKKTWDEVKSELDDEKKELLERFCKTDKLAFRHKEGCSDCYKGVTGRRVISEVIRPDAKFMALFRHEGKLAARSYWVNELNGITRGQHLLRYLHEGLVDPIDADYISPLDEDSLTLLPKEGGL
ncbi:TPA: Flp pilus assembly complex ATPase component TadA [Yersinia enterocolitica]|uniref:GspE/PulE family protein n=1 Tax=Yersinia TaxID=629 RepID=UPI0005E36816|nr:MULTISPECIES: ATPase, T2SS/T4P/T4SS family [Yersinia]CNI92834.1 putative type IV pilus protein [Yersinia intermedia]HDY4940543.1 Flp pilus assembly complex ATPase component TadA [Yersinia enterocolitica]HEA9924621.1 Flp pilus assembly complex ATPase component TadA [Yersinia enterocolitica]